jgi:VWFA-related protein
MRIHLAVFIAVLVVGSAFAQNAAELPSAPSSNTKTFPGGSQTTSSAPATAPAPQPAAAQDQPKTSGTQLESLPKPKVNQPSMAERTESKPAQDPPQATPEPSAKPADNDEDRTPITTISKIVNEVNLVFTATDKHGRFIRDLKREDLKVVDDGKPVPELRRFESETNLPLRVGLLIDASNSIRDRFRFEQESAVEFLNQIVRRHSDQAFVVGFDSALEVTQDFTDDTALLSQGVRKLRPGGGTALFDAVYEASKSRLMNAVSKQGPTRRAIILLTDGEDNQSRYSREEAIEMAQRAEVVIYAISTNISGTKSRGDKVLERFAEATGGRVFFPYKIQDVANAFTEIQDELRSQYAISYRPSDFVADGRFRLVSIEATKNKNVRVRARKGYYAQKAANVSSADTVNK